MAIEKGYYRELCLEVSSQTGNSAASTRAVAQREDESGAAKYEHFFFSSFLFAALCLQVYIRPGGPTINMEEEVVANRAQFGIDWLSAFLARREAGLDVVLISQVFKRSANVEITFAAKNIRTPQDFVDKNVCVWLGGNELSLRSLFDASGLTWDNDTSVNRWPGSSANIVTQSFSETEFLAGRCDAASATVSDNFTHRAAATSTRAWPSACDCVSASCILRLMLLCRVVCCCSRTAFAARSLLSVPLTALQRARVSSRNEV